MLRITGAIWAVLAAAAAAMATESVPTEMPVGMAEAEVIVLGEVHDNAAIHARQAGLVAEIAPRALVFEMLTPAMAARATPELRADRAALEQALNWAHAGWPDFAMYFPIFQAAPEAAIFGAAVPRAQARAAMEGGVAQSFGAEARLYGLSDPLGETEQGAREALQFAAHCEALPEDMLPGMVALQRLRDAVLARSALAALNQTGGPVVVITGNGHARKDWGVPVYLARADPYLEVFSLGLQEVGSDGEGRFDDVETFPEAERDDPCAVFRNN